MTQAVTSLSGALLSPDQKWVMAWTAGGAEIFATEQLQPPLAVSGNPLLFTDDSNYIVTQDGGSPGPLRAQALTSHGGGMIDALGSTPQAALGALVVFGEVGKDAHGNFSSVDLKLADLANSAAAAVTLAQDIGNFTVSLDKKAVVWVDSAGTSLYGRALP
jgi:hypothetical protein